MNLKDVAKYAHNKGYFIDKDGYLISHKGTKLNPRVNSKGYYNTNIRIEGKLYHLQCHTLAAYQKFGDKIFESECIRHLDGNRLNNKKENIEIGSRHDNSMDIPKEIRINAANIATKCTEHYHDDNFVKRVREYYKKVQSYKQTMEIFNITSKGTLYYMLHNR